jgi:hypothetical protein
VISQDGASTLVAENVHSGPSFSDRPWNEFRPRVRLLPVRPSYMLRALTLEECSERLIAHQSAHSRSDC